MSGHPTDDFPRLLDSFERLIQIAKAVPVNEENEWKANGQLLLIKSWTHFNSIKILGRAAIRRDSSAAESEYVDHSSIAVLGRAVYETYVLFNFIFLAENADVRNFRHQVWRLSGLMSRAKLNRPKGLPTAQLKQIEMEGQMIVELKRAIVSNPLFSGLDTKTQKNVQKGDGVRLGIALIDLAVEAGLPRRYSADMYTHFCNYSHASSISVYQIRDALNNGTSPIMARVVISFCCVLLAQTIFAYTELFSEVDVAVSTDSELSRLLALWYGMGKQLDGLY
jgi:hypothetical protein